MTVVVGGVNRERDTVLIEKLLGMAPDDARRATIATQIQQRWDFPYGAFCDQDGNVVVEQAAGLAIEVSALPGAGGESPPSVGRGSASGAGDFVHGPASAWEVGGRETPRSGPQEPGRLPMRFELQPVAVASDDAARFGAAIGAGVESLAAWWDEAAVESDTRAAVSATVIRLLRRGFGVAVEMTGADLGRVSVTGLDRFGLTRLVATFDDLGHRHLKIDVRTPNRQLDSGLVYEHLRGILLDRPPAQEAKVRQLLSTLLHALVQGDGLGTVVLDSRAEIVTGAVTVGVPGRRPPACDGAAVAAMRALADETDWREAREGSDVYGWTYEFAIGSEGPVGPAQGLRTAQPRMSRLNPSRCRSFGDASGLRWKAGRPPMRVSSSNKWPSTPFRSYCRRTTRDH